VSPRIRPDLRFVVGVRLPRELVASAEEEAQRSGRPVADLLGDLAAERLPEAIAEAARDQLVRDAAAAQRIVRGQRRAERLDAAESTNGSAPAVHRGTPDDLSFPLPSTLSIGASGRPMASAAHMKPDVNDSPD
jgi:hypothetical protein